jgi:hypothetical protein
MPDDALIGRVSRLRAHMLALNERCFQQPNHRTQPCTLQVWWHYLQGSSLQKENAWQPRCTNQRLVIQTVSFMG